jgi:hypothetical protein
MYCKNDTCDESDGKTFQSDYIYCPFCGELLDEDVKEEESGE